jgi:O-antigen/teichoic acid export membrane protein
MVLLLVILTYGMETAFFRFSQEKADYEKVYGTTLISLFCTSLLFILLVNIFIRPVSDFMNYSDNRDYIRMFAGIVAIDAFSAIPFARLRRENKPVIFSFIKIINVIVTIVLVLFLLKIAPGIYNKSNGWFRKIYDPEYKVGYVFIANLISSTVTMILLLPFIVKVKLRFNWKLWNRMVTYAFPLLLAGLSGSVNDAIDKVLLRRLLGENDGLAVVGEYGAAYKIGVLMALFIQMFRFAAEPFFFERAKQADAKKMYSEVMKYFIISMLMIYLALNLYISGFQLIVGRNYRDAIVVVPIISMAYLLYGIYINHSIWYKLNDLTRYAVYITIIGAAITLIINLIFIPVFGYMASAWAHVASYLSMLIFSFIFARKHYVVDYKLIALAPYFFLAVGMVVFKELYNYGNIFKEIIINTAFIAIFIGFAHYRDGILNIFKKRRA